MNEIYLVTGISGAGKTTVINHARKNFKHVIFGDIMLNIAKRKRLVQDRDQIKYLDNKTAISLQKTTVREISRMKGKILIDTHLAMETPYGYIPGIPFWMLKELNVQGIILIEAPSKEILKRRAKDKTIRKREKDTLEKLNQQRDMDRIAGMALSILSSAPLKIIENIDYNKAAQELSDFLRGKK